MLIKEKIRSDLKRYIQKSTSRRPMIMACHSGDLTRYVENIGDATMSLSTFSQTRLSHLLLLLTGIAASATKPA